VNKTFWLALFAFFLAVAAIVLRVTAKHGAADWTDIILPALIAGFMVILMLEHRPRNG
jgi:membrane protein CcdC involved in cytochrome C biogenesis